MGAGVALLSMGFAQGAHAAPGCVPATDVWLNSWDSSSETGTLQRFTVDPTTGALSHATTLPATNAYGDIAMSPDESGLYAVSYVRAPEETELIRLDPATGAELERTAIAPLVTTDGTAEIFNALSFSPDGRVFLGGPRTTNLFSVDPSDGSWTTPTPPSFPSLSDTTLLYSAGDFLTLPDGDLLAVLTNSTIPDGPWTFLSRIDLGAGTATVVARIADRVQGAAQAGGRVYLAAVSGTVYSIDEIPQGTDENHDITAQLEVALASDGVTSWWGATSAQDATGGCPVPAVPGTPPGEAPSEAPELAATGTEVPPLAALAGLTAIAGALLLAARAGQRAQRTLRK